MRKILNHFQRLSATILLLGIVLVAPVATTSALALPAPMAADSVSDACAGIGLTGAKCGNAGNNGGSRIGDVVKVIVNILTGIVGVAAVIMIIIGGFKYITSGGDANKVTGAKNTIIYAIIGLIVVALSQFIVHFVVLKVTP